MCRLAWMVVVGACTPSVVPATPPRADEVARCGPVIALSPPRPRTSRASLASGMLDVTGDVDAEVVSRALQAHADELRACFLHLLADDPRPIRLRVELSFAITGDGSVANLTADGGPLELDACVCERASELRFRAFDGRADVRYGLLFINGG
jgi:hypothetical protein